VIHLLENMKVECWEVVVDFTKISQGGVDIHAVLQLL